MKQIRTSRILIIPCSISLAKSLVLYPADFKMVSPVMVPDCFPSDRIKGILPLLIELFEVEVDAGLWICFIIDLKHQQFIGELEVEGNPAKRGTLTFSLNFIDERTEKEFASEVMEGLLYYFKKLGTTEIVKTEVLDKQVYFKNLLKVYGFEPEREDGRYCLMRKQMR